MYDTDSMIKISVKFLVHLNKNIKRNRVYHIHSYFVMIFLLLLHYLFQGEVIILTILILD